MFFYEVAPANRQYHGSEALTYSSSEKINPGRVIVVKIRGKIFVAFVVREVTKPGFKTSPIESVTDFNLNEIHIKLFEWIQSYYPGPVGVIAGLFLPFNSPKDYEKKKSKTISRDAVAISAPPTLTKDQDEAMRIINANQAKTVLLHGNTGSGKTRIYIEAANKVIAEGKSVLILVPEIALSPQIVKTFQSHMKAPVQVTHSGLTPAQRRGVWQSVALHQGPQIVIGPRSALFTPLSNIGLIVMDEFHEPAYKQDQSPYYQTIRVASQFANLSQAQLILGSATPSVSEYYFAEQKQIPIIRMEKKALASSTDDSPVKYHVVNLRDDTEKTKYPLITRSLIDAIKRSLSRQEQVLLFLNKRGSARVILCQNCGWHATCERCDLPLTYHADNHRLLCHTCGWQMPAPSVCPSCSSHDIIFKSPGTKAIVQAITNAFPEARIARFDKDNLKSERLEARHNEIVSGDIDILIGTQLLAKGHDLPRLSLVGIMLAENELQFPDYTSSERSYQLMHQLIGRVGRGHRAGEVVIQTYDPENEAVLAATANHSWQDFYQSQINERKLFGFPPYSFLMKIEISRARMATVESTSEQIVAFIQKSGLPVQIIGPAPSFIEKRNNTWNWQIIVKSSRRSALTSLATTIPVKCTINLDPSNLL